MTDAPDRVVHPSIELEQFAARMRRLMKPVPADLRAGLAGIGLGGSGLLGAMSLAMCLRAATPGAQLIYFLAFVAFAWIAVLVGEAVFARRDDRLAIEREGLYVSHVTGRYFVPWSQLAPFRPSNGLVMIQDMRLVARSWRTLLTPMALDPAQHDLGSAEQMCAELNRARIAAMRDAA